jgi:hypothetical protein
MRRADVRSALVAVAVHGAGLALLVLVAPGDTQKPIEARAETPPAEIELDVRDVRESGDSPAVTRSPAMPADRPARTAPSGPATATTQSLETRTSAARGPETPPSPESPAPDLDLSQYFRRPTTLSADSIGLGPRNVFLGGLPGGPERPPAPNRSAPHEAPGVEQSIRDALSERDREIGLAASGPIVGVAEEISRASETPWNSRATFEVTTDASGAVAAVRLLNASEAWGAWERVAKDLHAALRGRTLHVPAGSTGLAVTLDVVSRLQLPSGHDPDMAVSVLGLPVKKAPATSKKPQRVEILKPEVTIRDVDPQPDLSPPVKLPLKHVVIGLQLLVLGIDPTDLTPRPLRVVHSRIVREHGL